jgi:hypothetical protein
LQCQRRDQPKRLSPASEREELPQFAEMGDDENAACHGKQRCEPTPDTSTPAS